LPYLIRRLAGTIALLWVVSVAVFGLLHLAPGDPAAVVAGPDATPDQVDQVRQRLGLDRPLISQYVTWLGHVLRGDLGTSYVLNRPVRDLIADRVGSTVQLVLLAMIIMVAISLAAGIALSVGRRPAVRGALDLVMTVALSIPPFVSSILLIFLLTVIWPAFPSGGQVDFFSNPADSLRFLFLPALALALPQSAVLTRLLSTEIRRATQQEFVLTATAKGASRPRIVWSDVLPDSIGPYVVQLGINFGTLIGGALVVEAIFARAGIGGLLIDAVTKRDYPVAQGVLLVTIAVAVLMQLAGQLALSRIDPRITKESR
jgi:peptide/nickel transport system permease protein